MQYGMPYKGSKNRIAEWVISQLPPSEVFVDLFAGGCAVTHAALLSKKWNRVICNDQAGTPLIFREAIRGDFDNLGTVLDRAGFALSNDAALRLLYSFGNDARTYLWGEYQEKVKVEASRMLAAPSMHERRMHFRRFISLLRDYEARNGRLDLEGLERTDRMNCLVSLKDYEPRLSFTVADYRDVNIPEGATVYADPPYRNTGEHYCGFDFEAFDSWLGEVRFPVYVSEYDAPRGCTAIAEHARTGTMAANRNDRECIEKIFVQSRFR